MVVEFIVRRRSLPFGAESRTARASKSSYSVWRRCAKIKPTEAGNDAIRLWHASGNKRSNAVKHHVVPTEGWDNADVHVQAPGLIPKDIVMVRVASRTFQCMSVQ